MRFFRKRTDEEEMEDLACRFTRFWYECDPYEFRDNMETGETLDEAIERASDYIYDELMKGNFDNLITMLKDADTGESPTLEEDRIALIRDVNFIRAKNTTVSKNILEPIRGKRRSR